MKSKATLLLFFLVITISYGQEKSNINSSNYYDHYVDFPSMKKKGIQGKSITTNWLRLDEVIPVIMEELKRSGHKEIAEKILININNEQAIIVTVYSKKSKFGFLYIEGHTENPNKEHRIDRTQKKSTGVEYTYWKESPTGEFVAVKIEKLPKNILVLNENCYWYQYTDNPTDQKKLITKEDAYRILKEDIKSYLSKK